jgi:hypothetical protein
VYITTPGYSAVLYPAAQVFVATNYASTLTLGTGSAYPAGAFVFSGGPLYGNAVGLTNFPGSLQTVSSAQANFWRRTSTQPESWDDAGLEGQMTITPRDGTSRWVNVHDGTNWFRFQASWF